jgi:hypothetical protein
MATSEKPNYRHFRGLEGDKERANTTVVNDFQRETICYAASIIYPKIFREILKME